MLEHVLNREMLQDLERMIDARVERKLAEVGLDEWLTLERAAELLGCTPDAARKRIERGMPAAKMDGHWYVKRADIYDELERRRR